MLSKINHNRPTRVLDLACGTGLVIFALARSADSRSLLVGLDPSSSMLRSASRRKRAIRARCSLELVQAVGEFMPFRNGSFEYETVGLALRNFGDKLAMFVEAYRTLIDSGWFLPVDFVLPDKPLTKGLYLFHIFNVLPNLGRLVSSSWRRTLTYLARSIQLSQPPEETAKMLLGCGFRHTFFDKVTLGIVAVLGGQKWSEMDPKLSISNDAKSSLELGGS